MSLTLWTMAAREATFIRQKPRSRRSARFRLHSWRMTANPRRSQRNTYSVAAKRISVAAYDDAEELRCCQQTLFNSSTIRTSEADIASDSLRSTTSDTRQVESRQGASLG